MQPHQKWKERTMEKSLRLVIAGALMVAALFAASGRPALADYDDRGGPAIGLGIARVTYLDGDVLFNSPDTDEWAAVTPGFTLENGDRVWAGEDSKAEVKFRGGGIAWLNYESGIDIIRLSQDPDGDVYQVGLSAGEATFSVRNFRVLKSVFQVDTLAASIRAYGSALFRVTNTSDGSTQVGVTRGSVEVESQDGVTTVRKGDLLEVASDGYAFVSDLPERDPWDNWVASRMDRYIRPARSARYLPPDMGDYAYEFDQGGRWTSYGSYGNVWLPASVGADWSPYSNGRWVFAGGDYVWLGYDPWYAPFHYGRWYWDVSIGWFWIPPVTGQAYWSPGYVGWCYGPTSVYWVPLGPGETYYGRGYYGPQSVNIINVQVVNVKNVYVNSRARNGVVVVRTDDFRRGRGYAKERIRIREDENPFVHRGRMRDVRLTGGAPVREIKPTKEMRLPRPDVRPSSKALPPTRVEQESPVLRKRGLAREQGASAFKPGAKAQRKEERIERRELKKEERFQRQEQKREEGIQQKEQKKQEKEQRKDERIQQREQRREEGVQQKEQKKEERLQQREQRRDEGVQQKEQKKEEGVQQQDQKKEERIQQKEQRQDERQQLREQKERRPGFRRAPSGAQPEKGVTPETEKKVKEKKQKEDKQKEEAPQEGGEGLRPMGR